MQSGADLEKCDLCLAQILIGVESLLHSFSESVVTVSLYMIRGKRTVLRIYIAWLLSIAFRLRSEVKSFIDEATCCWTNLGELDEFIQTPRNLAAVVHEEIDMCVDPNLRSIVVESG